MVTLTRPDGTRPEDLNLSRRGLTLAITGGYALAAWSAEAAPIHTDAAGLITGMVEIPAADRQIPAYIARPAAKGRHPVILVYSEVFGLHEWVRDVVRRLAKAGYVALAPDFYVRVGDPSTTSDMGEVMKIVGKTPDAQVDSDSKAALKYLAAQPYADMKRLGVTGFCWGGGKAWLAAERYPEVKAVVAWYGPLAANPRVPSPAPLALVKDLHAPVLGLYGGQDKGIPQTDIEAMRAAAKTAGKTVEIHVYPDAQHGFLADYRPSYNQAAGEDGWKRMLAFFAAHGVK